MTAGDIGSEIQTLRFETVKCQYPEIINVTGDVYAIVYHEDQNDVGYLKTFTISSEGVIVPVGSLQFDTVSQHRVRIIHVAGDVCAIVYSGPDTDGWLRTVGIQSDGTITGSIASFEFDELYGNYPAIIHVSGDVYLIVYNGSLDDTYNRGYVRTIRISDNGLTIQSISSKVLVSTILHHPEVLHVTGDVFAYIFKAIGDDGIMETRKVYSDGSIEASPVATFTFDTYVNSQDTDLSFIQISSDVFAVVYAGEPYSSGAGFIKTDGIQTDGNITGEINSLIFDPDRGAFPSIVHVAGNAYIIAYMGKGGDSVNRGVYRSLGIASNGTIGSIIDTKIFNAAQTERFQDMIHVSGNVYACAYAWVSDYSGWLRTFNVDTSAAAAARHRFTAGLQHRPIH